MKLIARLLPLAVLFMAGACGGDASEPADEAPQFLAIQRAESGSITPLDEGTYLLELYEVAATTVLFADRPDRSVISEQTAVYVGDWDAGVDDFADDPPNAAIVIDASEERAIVEVAELTKPSYDSTSQTLSYVIVLEGGSSSAFPSAFDEVTLVIDGDCCTAWGAPECCV